MRIGVFGGTFDPPHTGHSLVAGDACESLELDTVLWIPAAQQPLKTGKPGATAEQRKAMVTLATEDDARFSVEPMELERGGLSFTVDTLAELRARHGVGVGGAAKLFLLLGADAWSGFHRWREPERIRQLAEIVVLARGDEPGPDSGRAGDRPHTVAVRRVDISSTEIRERVGRNLPITGFVRESVARYIAAEGLYQQGKKE